MSSHSPSPPPLVDATDALRHWGPPTWKKRLQWRLESWAYIGLERLLTVMSARAVARSGRLLGTLAYLAFGKRRRTVARNLRIALAGERPPAELKGMTAEVFKRSGANLLSSLRTAHLDEAGLSRTVQVKNLHYLQEAQQAGKGVMMVIAHMGNWEALAQWFPLWMEPGRLSASVYRPLNNPILNARLITARERRGLKMFSKEDSPLAMAAHLRAGGALGVLSDQRAGKAGELVPFFGRLTSCTPIPSVLARRTGAIVLGVSLRTLDLGRWEMKIHRLEGEPTTLNVMGLLERMIRESPEDVFWLQERWRIERRAPHKVWGKPPKPGVVTVPPTKLRRALLWADAAGTMPTRPLAEPADVDYEAAIPDGAMAPPAVAKLWIRGAEGPETTEAFLRRVDAGASLPLDFVVTGKKAEAEVRAVCKKLGLGWVAEGTP